MLPKSKRLNLKKDFKWVASGSPRSRLAPASTIVAAKRAAGGAGKKIETKYLKLFVKMGDNQMPRIGIAVSGKSFKKASLRNRAKRIVSAAFESIYTRLPASINIVTLPKIGVLNVKSQDVLLDLEEKLKDEKIID